MCMVSFSKYTSSFWGMILAKSLIVLEKTTVITAHLCSETADFAEIPAFRHDVSIRYSRTKNDIQF
jgi:hypothetical protein